MLHRPPTTTPGLSRQQEEEHVPRVARALEIQEIRLLPNVVSAGYPKAIQRASYCSFQARLLQYDTTVVDTYTPRF